MFWTVVLLNFFTLIRKPNWLALENRMILFFFLNSLDLNKISSALLSKTLPRYNWLITMLDGWNDTFFIQFFFMTSSHLHFPLIMKKFQIWSLQTCHSFSVQFLWVFFLSIRLFCSFTFYNRGFLMTKYPLSRYFTTQIRFSCEQFPSMSLTLDNQVLIFNNSCQFWCFNSFSVNICTNF